MWADASRNMNITVCSNPKQLGKQAAAYTAELLRQSIFEQGAARLVLSTGASQLDTLEALLQEEIDWRQVTVFHLDEYVGIAEDHPASFRHYLLSRFLTRVSIGGYHLVDSDPACIPELTKQLWKAPVDVGLIGIGENAHIAFNDPPADFDSREAFICVDLDEQCKQQQVGEGWFPSIEQVPRQAITMTVRQILRCRHIISCVPYAVKAKAVADVLLGEVSNQVPATILKTHPRFTLFLDRDSAAQLDEQTLRAHVGHAGTVSWSE